MPSRLRERRSGENSFGPRSFFILSQETQRETSDVENREAADNDDLQDVVQHLLSGEVALIACGAWCLAAQVRGRLQPELRIVALQTTSRQRKSIFIPLRGGVTERRREILGQLEFAMRPTESV